MSTATPQPIHPVPPCQFILSVTLTISESDVPAFLAALKPAYDRVLAEPENVFYNVGRKLEVSLPVSDQQGVPGSAKDEEKVAVFHFEEGWNASIEWFMNVQVKKDYYVPYLATTEKMWVKPSKLKLRS